MAEEKELPELTALELKVLKAWGKRAFYPYEVPQEEADAEETLLDKLLAFEEKYGLSDERIDHCSEANIFIWFYDKYHCCPIKFLIYGLNN